MLLNKKIKLFQKLFYLKIQNRLFWICYCSITQDSSIYSICITNRDNLFDLMELNGYKQDITIWVESQRQTRNMRICSLRGMIKYIKKIYF